MAPNRPKVPIFIRRQFPKTLPSRLSPEEIEAAAHPERVQAEPVVDVAPATIVEPTPSITQASPEPAAPAKAKPTPKPTPQPTPAPEPKPSPQPVVKPQPTPKPEPKSEPKPAEKITAEAEVVDKPTGLIVVKQKRAKRQHRRLPLSAIIRPLGAVKRLFTLPALDTWLLLLSLVALVVTQLTLIWFTRTGLVMNMVTLLLLTLLALFRESLRKVAISMAIIPVAQMVNSTIITHTAFETATVLYVIILVLTLTYRYLFTLDEPVTASRLSWKGHFFGLPLMLILGQLLGLIGYGALRHYYDYTHTSLPLVFGAIIIFAFAEEMLLRGLIQQQAARVTNPVVAVLLSSGLYAALTISHGTMLSITPAVASGVTLALVYHFKHNLVLTTAVNAVSKLAYVGLVATFILR